MDETGEGVDETGEGVDERYWGDGDDGADRYAVNVCRGIRSDPSK